MAKIIMSPPVFGWFDSDYDKTVSGFHPNATDPVHQGVSVIYKLKNNTGKTIKYYTVVFCAYNAVGDQIGDMDGCKGTGPVLPGQTTDWRIAQNVWHNNTISTVKLGGARIEYMDGTDELIYAQDIELGLPKFEPYVPKPTANTSSGGCYVATAVYGSYDCPEVWTLRRYRDHYLAESWLGRAFIRAYYAVSPMLVRWFGTTKWFRNFWKNVLDKKIQALQEKGYEDTPYDDKAW